MQPWQSARGMKGAGQTTGVRLCTWALQPDRAWSDTPLVQPGGAVSRYRWAGRRPTAGHRGREMSCCPLHQTRQRDRCTRCTCHSADGWGCIVSIPGPRACPALYWLNGGRTAKCRVQQTDRVQSAEPASLSICALRCVPRQTEALYCLTKLLQQRY